MSTLLGLCGSLRAGSFNRKLMHEAARLYGTPLTEADLRLPLYDGDLEQREGIPAAVTRLAEQIAAADAVLVATPEYNKALSGVMKNALDWISRTPGTPWLGKPVAVMSATGGRTGGERAQSSLRACMLPFRADIVPGPEILVAAAAKQFDEEGRLMNEMNLKALTEVMDQLRSRAGAAG
ncbi:NADPH-dependent FMN reductase [Jannaschia sp. 2305UL9-9]|uniref:NADPH-dependent FMN reductase n=1 Tax=Jannaschia sp. 2305UL9-9 TaxID=3121638 RepID=UPI003526DB5F